MSSASVLFGLFIPEVHDSLLSTLPSTACVKPFLPVTVERTVVLAYTVMAY